MSAPPPNNRRDGLIGTILDRLLGYADRPWRALFMLALIIVCGVGFAAWEERAVLLRLISHPSPTALRSDLAAVIVSLLSTTTVEGIAIWSVNLSTNSAQLIMARRRPDQPWLIQPTILTVIHEQSHQLVLARTMRGEATCVDPHEFEGPLGRFLVGDGWLWVCVVPEPPTSTELLIGVVLLAWRGDPGKPYTDQAIGVARSMTNQIIQR